jgi:flagellar hook-associated protein 3 FlgL
MRVSTNSLYLNNVSNMLGKQSALNKVQEQLSTLRKVNRPSDDPVAASQILDQTQAKDRIEQFNQNAKAAESSLALSGTSLQAAGDVLQKVRQMAIQAGNTTLTNEDRKMLNSELEGLYKQMLGYANTLDGNGKALFGGSISQTKPYSELQQFGTAVAAGSSIVQYNGDANRQEMMISSARQVPVTDNGQYVFGSIPEGNGLFKLGAGSTLSNVQVDLGSVVDRAKFDAQVAGPLALPTGALSQAGARIEVVFGSENDGVAGQATEFNKYYDVVLFDGVNYTSLVTGQTGTRAAASDLYNTAPEQVALGNPKSYPKFQTGADINLDFSTNLSLPPAYRIDFGVKFSMASEAPANGGVLTLEPSKTHSIFDTLNDFSRVLQSSAATPADATDFANRLGNVIANIDNTQTRILSVEARIGANRNEADALVEVGSDFALQYKAILSRLQDVDVASAASELSLAKLALDASQNSFAKVQGLSLFNYI